MRDLPEHRDAVINTLMRLNMLHPEMVRYLTEPTADELTDALRVVDEAEIYLGVFAFLYGNIPEGQTISVAEAQYLRAVERNIPRLIFLMGDRHPVTARDIETGEGAEKLRQLKERLQKERSVAVFDSVDSLKSLVIQALVPFRESDLATFHYVSDIPAPPEAFVAHPYTLLRPSRLVGRQHELNLLTDWVTRSDAQIYQAHILSVVAIGGLGKSALTWKWFNDIAPQEMKPLAGRMWWSFYESDATFENFVTRALAYVTRRALDEVQKIPAYEREMLLLAALDREPFLIVLDGLERILIAYARMDAAHLIDNELDRKTADIVAGARGLPESAAQSFTGELRLRKTADPRAGAFLRKLSNVRASRILASTRLYPADLQTAAGEQLPGCAVIFLPGLADNDAIELWRTFGVTGARDLLIPLFNRVGNHPLLIQTLASEVARYRLAPGDFEKWRRDHPDFDPFSLPLVQAESHVLEFALRGLDEKARQALHVIAAFRMPASYDTLTAVLIGPGKASANEYELDKILKELEDRGLVGWDKRSNRYDLHPIVRGVVWASLGDDSRRGVYTSLRAHFEALPQLDDWQQVKSIEDLAPAIELYNTLIGLGRYEDAGRLFYERLEKATLYRLSASRQRVELLEMLFPDGLDQLPRRSSSESQVFTLNALAVGYRHSGQPGRAAPLFRRSATIYAQLKRDDYRSISLSNLSDSLRLSGPLCESEAAARRALVITRQENNLFQEAISLYLLGLTLAARSMASESEAALQRSLRMFVAGSFSQSEGLVNSYLAQRSLWLGEFTAALSLAERAWELAHEQNLEGDFIRAARIQSEAALGLDDLPTADERLHHAIARARRVDSADEELPALVALAELQRRHGEVQGARELLDDIWDVAERGPYPLLHADAYNVLAQIERDAGNRAAAVVAAARAYELAWCDGPPFSYYWGLEAARKHLQRLGASEPLLPPFDESKFEPMPQVEIDPEDEFHAGREADD